MTPGGCVFANVESTEDGIFVPAIAGWQNDIEGREFVESRKNRLSITDMVCKYWKTSVTLQAKYKSQIVGNKNGIIHKLQSSGKTEILKK